MTNVSEIYIIMAFAVAVPVLLITIDRLVDAAAGWITEKRYPITWVDYVDLSDVEL